MHQHHPRRHFLKTLALAGAALGSPAFAQTAAFPSRPIRMVVPFAPGGNTDLLARLLSQGLSENLGQPVVVENMPGANGSIGASRVAAATGDGYTLLFGTAGTQAINLSLYKSLGEKNLEDFEYIALITAIPNVLVINPARTPAQSVAQLVEYARNRHGGLSFGSPGSGSSVHLSGELFKTATQIDDLVHVPYKGSAPALTDLVGGQIDFIFENITPALPFIQSGRLKPLAVTADERVPLLPNVPTMKESGYPDFVTGTWNGVLAPRDTPIAVVQRLEAATLKVAGSADFQDKVAAFGGQAELMDAARFRAFTYAEFRRWGAVIGRARLAKL